MTYEGNLKELFALTASVVGDRGCGSTNTAVDDADHDDALVAPHAAGGHWTMLGLGHLYGSRSRCCYPCHLACWKYDAQNVHHIGLMDRKVSGQHGELWHLLSQFHRAKSWSVASATAQSANARMGRA